MDKIELEKAQDRLRLCGRNRGDHAYIPVLKEITKNYEALTHLMCLRCFLRVSVEEIRELFPESIYQ